MKCPYCGYAPKRADGYDGTTPVKPHSKKICTDMEDIRFRRCEECERVWTTRETVMDGYAVGERVIEDISPQAR